MIGIDVREPLQVGHDVRQLLLFEVKVRHLAAPGDPGGLRLDPGGNEVRTPALVNIAQLRGKVGAFAVDGMTAGAVVGIE